MDVRKPGVSPNIRLGLLASSTGGHSLTYDELKVAQNVVRLNVKVT